VSASDAPKKVSGGIFGQPSEKFYVMGASATVGGVSFNVASIDSGSDADTFPHTMAHFGRQVVNNSSRLFDIQGGGIKSYGTFDLKFRVTNIEGVSCIIQRRLMASDG
jgi:hypothetical protein